MFVSAIVSGVGVQSGVDVVIASHRTSSGTGSRLGDHGVLEDPELVDLDPHRRTGFHAVRRVSSTSLG
jgi:hypothetical protein